MATPLVKGQHRWFYNFSPDGPRATWVKPATGESGTLEAGDLSGVFPSGFSISPAVRDVGEMADLADGYNDPYGVVVTYPDTEEWAGFYITDLYYLWRRQTTDSFGVVSYYYEYFRGVLATPQVLWANSFTAPENGSAVQFQSSNVSSRSSDNPRALTFSSVTSNGIGNRPATSTTVYFDFDFAGTIESYPYTVPFGSSTAGIAGVTHTFPDDLEPAPVRVRLRNEYGQRSLWTSAKIRPYPVVSIDSSNENAIVLDASESFDIDGEIIEYTWNIHGNITQVKTGPVVTFNLDEVATTVDTASITLTIKDDDPRVSATSSDPTFVGLINTSVNQVVRQGLSAPLLYDRRSGELRVLYRDTASALRCARHLRIEPPQLTTSQPLVANSKKPGALLRYGAKVFALSDDATLYYSDNCGQTWSGGSALRANSRLLGATITPDGSTLQSLVKDVNNSTYHLLTSKRSGATSWSTEVSSIAGLSTANSPALLLRTGNEFVLIAKSGSNVVFSTSANAQSWNAETTLASGHRLIGAARSGDHSQIFVLVATSSNVPKRIVLTRTGAASWQASAIQSVTGLSSAVQSPSALECDGPRTLVLYKDGSTNRLAVSTDCGQTWTVAS